MMNFELRFFPGAKLIGISYQFENIKALDLEAQKIIPNLWKTFWQTYDEIKSSRPKKCFGVTSPGTNGERYYLAGCEAALFQELPDKFQVLEIPPGNYQYFKHVGPSSEMEKTFNYIYKEWLPANRDKLRLAPHFELYDDRYKGMSPGSEFEIAVAVK